MRNKEIKDIVYSNVYQNASTGYVLTPSELASEMVSTLPNSVFESDSTNFLDPICKSGTFLFEIVEKLYDQGHSLNNIQSRIYTIDSNSSSLNIADSYIKKILNKESGSFKVDYKYEFVERFYNRLISVVSKGKYTTFDDFLSIIIIDKKEKYLMVELKNNISKFIEKYEKVSKLESKLFGEVFTPRQLIDEMLDTLPEEVWTNPDLKWMDPAVGIGNFPAAILDRLMVGLNTIITNEDERRKHILEEMLYMCDISSKNLFLLYMLFDKNNEFKLNVYRGSFLTDDFDRHMSDNWKLNEFNVILGNPPYNNGNQKNFYVSFFNKSFELLKKEQSYICFVTPSRYVIQPEFENLRNLIEQNSKNVVLKNKGRAFGDGASFTVVVSTIYSGNGCDVDWLTGFENPIVRKVLSMNNSKLKTNRSKAILKNKEERDKFDDVKTTENKYLYFVNSKGNSKTPFRYLKDKIGDTFVPKIVMTEFVGTGKNKTLGKIYVDYNGDWGLATDTSMYIIESDKEKLKKLEDYLSSKIIDYLVNEICQSSHVNQTMRLIPDITNYLETITNDKIYEYFSLTKEEIDLIEKKIKD